MSVYWLCYCVASCNRYLMLINHPTDGATCVFCVQLRSGDGVALLLTLSLTVGVVGLTLRGGGGGGSVY